MPVPETLARPPEPAAGSLPAAAALPPRDERRRSARRWLDGASAAAAEPATAEANGHADEAATPAADFADPDLLRLFRAFAVLAGLGVAAIGAVVLFGWLADLPLLTQLHSRWISMKANTAAGLILAGSALALSASGRREAFAAMRVCGMVAAALGLATLVEYVSGRSLGIDQLLVVEPPGTILTPHPGRMAQLTAANFVLCGLALAALATRKSRWSWPSGALALPTLLVATVNILGYLFGAEELNTLAGHVTATAFHTSAAFLLLSGGLIACRIEHSPLRRLASSRSGGVMLRKLLPLNIMLTVIVVWLRLQGEAAGLFSTVEFGAASVAAAMMFAVSGTLLWCAALLDRLDLERLAGERQIRELNLKLRQRVSELEVANKELEGFSYATSHVLRAPLRAMDGFSRILLEDYGDKLDDEAKRRLGVVRSSAQEMGELIDGIFGFIRLGREALSPGPVDMDQAVRTALEELEPRMRGRKFKLEIAPLPAAVGDAAMIRRIWINLLDNAVKFTAAAPEARIEVGATRGEHETVYHVRDNGVGFDMQFAAKLFGVFNRLHGAEFPGNGMGLAIVQRAVSRHGGRVWAEGKPGAGATFYFSLPHEETRHG